MALIGTLFIIIGFLIALVFGIQLLIIAFQTSILWGLGYIFIPFVSIIFVILHWERTKKPFLFALTSIPFFVIGVLLSPGAAQP